MNEQALEAATPVELEVAPIEAITRAEIDVQIATARQFPRSLAQFYKRAEAMVTVDQETAETCFYQLRRKDRTAPGGYKIIEGESIRLAEIVAATFGNLRSAVHIVGHTPTRVTVRAVCHDLETNNLVAVEKQTKTTYSDGSPYNEDMSIITTNALVSKALRDAIFRVVPKALVKPLKEKAKMVAFGQGAAFLERRKKAIAWATESRKVPLERVLAALDVKGVEDITVDHLAVLSGLKQAIMDGDQTVEEAFPSIVEETRPQMTHPEKAKQQAEQKAPAPKPVAKVEPKPEPKPEPKKAPEPEPAQEAEPQPEPEPETKPEGRAEEPEAQTAPEETKPETEEELAAAGLAPLMPTEESEPEKPIGEKQAQFRDALTEAGITFEEFLEVGIKGKFIPPKTSPKCPKDWADLPDDKIGAFIASVRGVIAAVNKAKNKK